MSYSFNRAFGISRNRHRSIYRTNSGSTSFGKTSILSTNFVRPSIIISFISFELILQNPAHATSCLSVGKLSPSTSNHTLKSLPKELIQIGDLAVYSPQSSICQSEQSKFDIQFFLPFVFANNVRRIIDHLGRFFRLLCALLTIPHISQHFQALV